MEFDQVSFGYVPGQTILDRVSLCAQPGQMVALVGPTGAGKSTLINLILRFYDVTGGAVKIDGIDVRQVTQASLRQQIGIVLQDNILFGGTVAENIAFGQPDASQAEIEAAAQVANVHEFIVTLPQGYATVLGEQGASLSQGQRQLMGIARAVLVNPRILILDEATSSLDTQTERWVQDAIATLLKTAPASSLPTVSAPSPRPTRFSSFRRGRLPSAAPTTSSSIKMVFMPNSMACS